MKQKNYYDPNSERVLDQRLRRAESNLEVLRLRREMASIDNKLAVLNDCITVARTSRKLPPQVEALPDTGALYPIRQRLNDVGPRGVTGGKAY